MTKEELLILDRLRERYSAFATEPYGDLLINADRAAGIAVSTIREMGFQVTRDEKKVLKYIGGMLLFNVILFVGINYSTKVSKKVAKRNKEREA